AEEVREILAELGFRSLEEAIGHSEVLDTRDAIDHWKADGLDLDPILHGLEFDDDVPLRNMVGQNHELDKHFDQRLITMAQEALSDRMPVKITLDVINTDRSVGTMLGHVVTKTFGTDLLATDTIDVTLNGTAGQSLGAFLCQGITLEVFGDANDYVGKGLSGGRIIVRPTVSSPLVSQHNSIVGNTVLYGATAGTLLAAGQAGERFAVRNSGAKVVIEGCGANGCEYMTGGTAVILGAVGSNFGAGMTGGMAFVLDVDDSFERRANPESIVWQRLDSAHWEGALRALVEEHAAATGSKWSAEVLADWDRWRTRFWQVCPKEMIGRLAHPLSDRAAEAVAAE
ncbi:MAG: glutamate synthase large subunit, partial [Sphingopyxis terrae]|nr:glutamate synthase large subunit [Sphingopyxis terrae]